MNSLNSWKSPVELAELVDLVEDVEIDGEVENLRAGVSLMFSHRPVTR